MCKRSKDILIFFVYKNLKTQKKRHFMFLIFCGFFRAFQVFRIVIYFSTLFYQSPPQVLEEIEYLEKTIGIPIFSRIYVCMCVSESRYAHHIATN